MTPVLIATSNPGKISEIRAILRELAPHIPLIDAMACDLRIAETGATYRENARIKAKAYFDYARIPSLADDSGLEIDALSGAPGVHSARFTGHGARDEQNNQKVLSFMKNIPPEERSARFVCHVVLQVSDDVRYEASGAWEGSILTSVMENAGFGYDPIFSPAAHMTRDQKNLVSHRRIALEKLLRAVPSPYGLQGS